MRHQVPIFLFTFLTFIVIGTNALAQSKKNIQLLAHWDSDTILQASSQVKFSDVWGYEQDGKEYALICSTEGVHFFEIGENDLRFVDFIEGTYKSATVTNRDVTTYKHYAYTGADHGTSNLQILDLSHLPDSVTVAAELDDLFGRIHNLFVDEENALLYVCRITPILNGNPTSVIPMRVFSLADPLNPTLLYEGPPGLAEVHDIWVQNNIAILNCGFDGIRVYDFTNPSAPIFKQNLNFYQQQGYNHQGALTPNGEKYVFGDETPGKPLKLADFNQSQLQITHNFGTNFNNNSIPHNLMCTDEYAIVAYYNEGLRIYDIRNAPKEIAHYDTYPHEVDFKMNGAWGVYSKLPSDKILVSDIQSGLYVFDFDRELFKTPATELNVYPTYLQSGDEMTIRLEQQQVNEFEVKVYDLAGNIISEQRFFDQSYGKISPQLSQGIYFLEVIYIDYLKEEQRQLLKFLMY